MALANVHRPIRIFHQDEFGRRKFLKTCYPSSPPPSSKGWCVVRQPGIDEDKEPAADSGWGFCSGDPLQENCNRDVSGGVRDYSATKVTVIDESYCVDKLVHNK